MTSTLRELLGALGDRARVLGLRGGVLHVAVESSSALYEIRQFREQELLTALIQKFPKRHFRRLKLIVQPLREIEEE